MLGHGAQDYCLIPGGLCLTMGAQERIIACALDFGPRFPTP